MESQLADLPRELFSRRLELGHRLRSHFLRHSLLAAPSRPLAPRLAPTDQQNHSFHPPMHQIVTIWRHIGLLSMPRDPRHGHQQVATHSKLSSIAHESQSIPQSSSGSFNGYRFYRASRAHFQRLLGVLLQTSSLLQLLLEVALTSIHHSYTKPISMIAHFFYLILWDKKCFRISVCA